MNTQEIDSRTIRDAMQMPSGMAEYELRNAVRAIIAIYGFEGGRQIIAEQVNDFADRRRAA